MQNSLLTHPTGHFRVICFCKNWDLSYQHIYFGHPLKIKGVRANIILGNFTGATPNDILVTPYAVDYHLGAHSHSYDGGRGGGKFWKIRVRRSKNNNVLTLLRL